MGSQYLYHSPSRSSAWDLSHGIMQGANIAFSKAIGFVGSRGHYILIDPVLGTVSFRSGTLESGPLIGDDDVREPELGVDLFFEGLDRGVGSDIGDRDENGVSGQDIYYHQTQWNKES